ncbi:MAG: SAM-dependent methyltransferase [Clostridia bacterium]|nr:SAM-dependent methyltransferase [Clostridia bacterium]
MTERLKKILSEITPCRKFADVGCDHGYAAKAVLDEGIASFAVVSDISAPSLQKAVKLLAGYGNRVRAVVCNGFEKIDPDCDQALIAGMGGEEIINILEGAPFLPARLVLQPMKNADKLRKRLLSIGYRILKDYLFKDGKYYFLIVAEKGSDEYTDDELFFGRDNLTGNNPDFTEYAKEQTEKYARYLSSEKLGEESRAEILKIIERYERVLK